MIPLYSEIGAPDRMPAWRRYIMTVIAATVFYAVLRNGNEVDEFRLRCMGSSPDHGTRTEAQRWELHSK